MAIVAVLVLLLLSATACNAALPRYVPPNEPPASATMDGGPPSGLKFPDSAALTVADADKMDFRELRHHLELRHRSCHTCDFEASKKRLTDAIIHGTPVFDSKRREEIARKRAAIKAKAEKSEKHAERAHHEAMEHHLAEAKSRHPQLAHLHDRIPPEAAGSFVKLVREHHGHHHGHHHSKDLFEAEEAVFKQMIEHADAEKNNREAARRARAEAQDPDEL